jgi:hypothetical protein
MKELIAQIAHEETQVALCGVVIQPGFALLCFPLAVVPKN